MYILIYIVYVLKTVRPCVAGEGGGRDEVPQSAECLIPHSIYF
jgi:hypothetical protein